MGHLVETNSPQASSYVSRLASRVSASLATSPRKNQSENHRRLLYFGQSLCEGVILKLGKQYRN